MWKELRKIVISINRTNAMIWDSPETEASLGPEPDVNFISEVGIPVQVKGRCWLLKTKITWPFIPSTQWKATFLISNLLFEVTTQQPQLSCTASRYITYTKGWTDQGPARPSPRGITFRIMGLFTGIFYFSTYTLWITYL